MPDNKLMSKANSSLATEDFQTPIGHALQYLPSLDASEPQEPVSYDPEAWKREWEARECFNAFKNHVMVPTKR